MSDILAWELLVQRVLGCHAMECTYGSLPGSILIVAYEVLHIQQTLAIQYFELHCLVRHFILFCLSPSHLLRARLKNTEHTKTSAGSVCRAK